MVDAERLQRARERHDQNVRKLAEVLDANERDPTRREQMELEESAIELGRALAGLPALPTFAPEVDFKEAFQRGLAAAIEEDATPRCGARKGKGNGEPCHLKQGHASQYHSNSQQTWLDRKTRRGR